MKEFSKKFMRPTKKFNVIKAKCAGVSSTFKTCYYQNLRTNNHTDFDKLLSTVGDQMANKIPQIKRPLYEDCFMYLQLADISKIHEDILV